MQAYCQNIKQYRIAKGMSQQELADAAGYKSRSSINKIEKGQTLVTLHQAKKIARALGVSITDLVPEYEAYADRETKKEPFKWEISMNSKDNVSCIGEEVYQRFFSRNDAVSKAFKEFANTLMLEEQRKLSSADNKLLDKYNQLSESNQRAVMMMIESLLAQQKALPVEGEGS